MPMRQQTSQVCDTKLFSPAYLIEQFSPPSDIQRFIAQSRTRISAILSGASDKLLIIVGPCSIHDTDAALEYADQLAHIQEDLHDDLHIAMRVYFEKPRSCLGWKGFLNDPNLDESYDIDSGLKRARQLLLDIASLRLSVATEFLDTIGYQYLCDLVIWGAVGARTTESQVHREMASGLPCPIGFKNATNGDVKPAIEAIRASRRPHRFVAVTAEGAYVRRATPGNVDGHLVLRGGSVPNYDAHSVASACEQLAAHALPTRVIVDASHGNSGKQHQNQLAVCDSLGSRISLGDTQVAGIMIESNLLAGNQPVAPLAQLTYGQSVTDPCLGWDDTAPLLRRLANDVQARRKLHAPVEAPVALAD